MKKSMLCAGLMTVLSATAFAENPVADPLKTKQLKVSSSNTQPNTGTQTPPTGTQTSPSSDTPLTPKTLQTQPTPTINPKDANTPPTGVQTPPTGTQTPPTGTQTPPTGVQTPPTGDAPAVKAAQPLNCNYRISAGTTKVDQTFVMKWAEKATEQSFDFDFKTIDDQIAKLKPCFTDQGWQGFNDAFDKSGNLNAIKSQQLTVSSMVNGQSTVTEIKDNQWKVSVPLQVVYQNDKEKLTQPLTVDLVVGRKASGDLGIMQMIAVPRQATAPGSTTPASTGTPATTTTPAGTTPTQTQ